MATAAVLFWGVAVPTTFCRRARTHRCFPDAVTTITVVIGITTILRLVKRSTLLTQSLMPRMVMTSHPTMTHPTTLTPALLTRGTQNPLPDALYAMIQRRKRTWWAKQI